MRLALPLVPLAMLSGCWDFQALTQNTPIDSPDGFSRLPDLSICEKSQLPLAEICGNGIDDNENCATDCEDPQCSDAVDCNGGTSFLGYGKLFDDKNATCGNGQTGLPAKQNPVLSGDCSSGCGCKSGAECTSTLRWFNDKTSCDAKNGEVGNLAVKTSTAMQCAATGLTDQKLYFRVDPSKNTCAVDTAKTGNLGSSWMTDKKLCVDKVPCTTFSCMKNAGATHIVFDGDKATCPPAYPVRAVYYQGLDDKRTCACGCNGAAGTCTLANTGADANLHTKTNCGGGGDVATNLTAADTCVQSAAGATAAASFFYKPAVACTATGTAPTDVPTALGNGQLTLKTAMTVCSAQ